ncbi:MAG: PilZ domain-containing protein [Leptospiraceae bacterium]|nr:PilZ domain-containing protein [Leptospiraceae bacterium]
MEEKRHSQRLRHAGFAAFQVELSIKQDSFSGVPGDFSESGMSLLIAGSEPLQLAIGDMAHITVQSAYLARPFQTPVRMVREESYELEGKPCRLVGLAFPEGTEVPDAIIAIDIMSQN